MKKYSIKEVMLKLGLSRPTLQKMMDANKIGYHKIEGRYFISEGQIEDYLESVKVDPK